MTRALVILVGVAALAGCAGSHAASRSAVAPQTRHESQALAAEWPRGTPEGFAARIAGGRYFAGLVEDPAHNTVRLNLVHAPRSIIERLRAAYPETYVIASNDAPRTWAFVTHLQRSHAWFALKSKGIDVNEVGPSQDGHLRIGVSSSVAAAQAYFDRRYGPNLIRAFHAEPGSLI